MTTDEERADRWWASLSDEQHSELKAVEGVGIPTWAYESLQAYDILAMGAKQVEPPLDNDVYVMPQWLRDYIDMN